MLTASDISTLMQSVAAEVAPYVKDAVAPVTSRVATHDGELCALTKRIERVESIQPVIGKDGRDGLDGKDGAPGLVGERGADGLPGKDADPEVTRVIAAEAVTELVEGFGKALAARFEADA